MRDKARFGSKLSNFDVRFFDKKERICNLAILVYRIANADIQYCRIANPAEREKIASITITCSGGFAIRSH